MPLRADSWQSKNNTILNMIDNILYYSTHLSYYIYNFQIIRCIPMNKLSSPKYFIPLSLLASIICGIIDFNSYEVQLPALCVLIASAAFGFLNPKYSWLSAILIGTGIVIIHVIAVNFGYKPAYNVPSNPLTGLVALIPAAIGTAAGIFTKKFFNYSLK